MESLRLPLNEQIDSLKVANQNVSYELEVLYKEKELYKEMIEWRSHPHLSNLFSSLLFSSPTFLCLLFKASILYEKAYDYAFHGKNIFIPNSPLEARLYIPFAVGIGRFLTRLKKLLKKEAQKDYREIRRLLKQIYKDIEELEMIYEANENCIDTLLNEVHTFDDQSVGSSVDVAILDINMQLQNKKEGLR